MGAKCNELKKKQLITMTKDMPKSVQNVATYATIDI